jgi:hypothetical protein
MVGVNPKAPSLLFYITKTSVRAFRKSYYTRRRVSHLELLFNYYKYDSQSLSQARINVILIRKLVCNQSESGAVVS